MELRNIQTFLTVAEFGSFSKAAEHLGYSQPTITIQIAQLEEELGVALFDRIGKQIKLTDPGRDFEGHASEILSKVDAAKLAMRRDGDITGTLRIGVAESLSLNILPKAITEFQKRCPKVETIIRTDVNELMYKAFRRNELDLIYFMDTIVRDKDWVKVFERPEPIHFTVAADDILAGQEHVSLERLLREPLFLTEKNASYCHELERILALEGHELHPMLEAGNTDLIIHLLRTNGGVGFLPEYAIGDLVREGVLNIARCDEVNVKVWSQLAYNRKKWVTPQMQVFIDIMKELEGDTSQWGLDDL